MSAALGSAAASVVTIKADQQKHVQERQILTEQILAEKDGSLELR